MAKKVTGVFFFQTKHLMDIEVPDEMTKEEFENKFQHMLMCIKVGDMGYGWHWKTMYNGEPQDVVFEGGASVPCESELTLVDTGGWDDE